MILLERITMKEAPTESLVRLMISKFAFQGELSNISTCTQGHINDSYFVDTTKRKYFLQRVSPTAFSEPKKVMNNIIFVTEFLRKEILARNGNPDEECLTLVKTIDDDKYATDDQGRVWRMYLFVEGMVYDTPKNEEVFGKAGEAFGRFQHELSSFPSESLFEVIPHFHDTPKRFRDLETAIHDDKAGRVSSVKDEIQFAFERKDRISLIVDSLATKDLPFRATHNDTKLNNIMFDKEGKNPKCILDLDTVMVGSSLYDFGDAIRYGANTASEDEKDLSKVHFSLPMFKSYAKGFLRGAEGSLTKTEIELFPYSARLLTFECGIRFLTDYLNGDLYFHTEYPGHNLVRALDQFALVKDMEAKEKESEEFVKSLLRD